MNVPGLAVEVGHAVLRLGLVPDDRHVTRVARGDPRPEHPGVPRMRNRDRSRPGLAEVLCVDELDRVCSRRLGAAAAAARPRLPLVRVPHEVDGATGVDRDRGPVGEHRRPRDRLVRRERGPAGRHGADADAEAPVPMVEDRWLDDGAARLVVVELSEARVRAAVGKRAVVGDTCCATRVPAVVRDEDLMTAPASLDGVGREVDLIRLGAGEPRAVSVVTVGRSPVPGLPSVDRREERVVGEVDPRVVDAASRVLREVRIAETCVDRGACRTRGAEVAVAVPVRAVVRRGPDVHLVAVVGHEVEVAPR